MTTLAAETVARPGYLAGFASLDAEVELDRLPVAGEIPAWLGGTLLRNGPAMFEAGERPLRHWFDGQAMLHRFRFDGGCVSYANRFLRTDAYRAVAAGRVGYREFATDPSRSLLKRAATIFRLRLTDNCNDNLVRLGDEFVAMTDSPMPVAFDPETLETRGPAFSPPGMHTTAHPHRDPRSGELISFATRFGPRSEYRIFSLRPGGRPRTIASHQVSEPSYMHSFALTERHVVLVAFPLVVCPIRIGLANRPFIENFQWKPELGTQLLVFDRRDGVLRGTYEAAPCFGTHHVNAFECEGELSVDFVAYDGPEIIDALYLERLRVGGPEMGTGRLLRYRIDLGRGNLVEEQLGETRLELPRIDYDERNGKPYRFVYGAGVQRDEDHGPDFLNQIVKVDVSSGRSWTWWEPGSYPTEALFVPRPRSGRREDDGVLLSVVLDGRSASSYLLVLDAASMRELGRAWLPHHVPFGFHGQYYV